jgi:CBS domain-containing protein
VLQKFYNQSMPKKFHDVSHIAEFLHKIQPFNALETAELHKLARRLEAEYCPQGKTIFSSRPAPGLAIIRKGAVRLVDEKHKFLDKRSEGELFGHSIFFHGALKDYVAEAEEDCLLWHLSAVDFDKLRMKHALINEYFSSHLKTRLSSATHVKHAATQVRDLLQREPVVVDRGVSIREAAQRMSAENVSSVLIMCEEELCGIVTDKDLRHRVLAEGVDSSQAIESVMTGSLTSLAAEAGVDAALLLMMREDYHHLPIVDGGRPLGLVTAGDILRAQSEHPLRVVRDIHKKDSLEELLVLSLRLPSLFERMVSLGRDVEQIGRMFTLITDAFTIRLIQLAERQLGPPPMVYAWVVFGSQAREAQTARTDQDNGLILERDADKSEAAYFAKLSELVCGGLDQLGYVYCPGEVMALNVKWRVSLSRWKRHFDRWIDEPDPKSVMHCSIFFDIRCVYGDSKLVDELQEHASVRARENRIFRRFMAANVLTHSPPLGFFRRFVQEDDGSHSEGLNLKHRGIVPITGLVRMRALEAGIREANTFQRLSLAVEAGVMNENDASSLRDALILINRIRLSHQAAQMAAGEKPTNFVPPEDLSPLMRRNLKAAFMLVVEAQKALELRYQVH